MSTHRAREADMKRSVDGRRGKLGTAISSKLGNKALYGREDTRLISFSIILRV